MKILVFYSYSNQNQEKSLLSKAIEAKNTKNPALKKL